MADGNIEFPVVIDDFSSGWIADRDPFRIPSGAFSGGHNINILPGGSIKTAPQYELIGTSGGDTSSPITSSGVLKTRYNDSSEVFHSGTSLYYWNTKTEDYAVLKTGLADGAFFAFVQSSENTDYQDYLYMGNAIDNDMRWIGAHDKLNVAVSGTVTEIEISSSIFTSVEHVSETATSCTDVSITLSSANWGTNIFTNFYVEIIDGTYAGKVARITSNTDTVLTFASISGLSGTPQFKIRTLRFEHTGLIVINGQSVQYTGFVSSQKFAVSGTYSFAINSPVAQAVVEFASNPKGNMMVMKDGYRLVASTMSSTIHRSEVLNHSSFVISSPRVPGQGDIIDVSEGTGNITGLANWGGYFVVIKKDLIKPYSYSSYNQASGAVDGNDVLTSNDEDVKRAPLIGGSFPLGTFQIENALVTCISGRGVRILASSENFAGAESDELSAGISIPANRFLSDRAAGIQFLDDIYISTKVDSDSSKNDITLIYNKRTGSWSLPRVGWSFSSFFEKDGELYATSSIVREVYKLNKSLNVDMNDGESYPTSTRCETGLITGAKKGKRTKFSYQYILGRMNRNTELVITRKLLMDDSWKEQETLISNSLTPGVFVEDETETFLGSDELGREPLASALDTTIYDFTDMVYFIAYIEWKPLSCNGWKIEYTTDGNGQEYEILEHGFATIEDVATLNKKFFVSPAN